MAALVAAVSALGNAEMGLWLEGVKIGVYNSGAIQLNWVDIGFLLPRAWIGVGTNIGSLAPLEAMGQTVNTILPLEVRLYPLIWQPSPSGSIEEFLFLADAYLQVSYCGWAANGVEGTVFNLTSPFFGKSIVLDVCAVVSIGLSIFPLSIRAGYRHLEIEAAGDVAAWSDDGLYLGAEVALAGYAFYPNHEKGWNAAPWMRTLAQRSREARLRREENEQARQAAKAAAEQRNANPLSIYSVSVEEQKKDGVLQEYEKATIRVQVRNEGDRPLKGVRLTYKLPSWAKVAVTMPPAVTMAAGSLAELDLELTAGRGVSSGDVELQVQAIDASGTISATRRVVIKTLSLEDIVEKPVLPPFPVTKVTISPESGVVKAGQELSIAVTVENIGKGAFYKLQAHLESPSEYLNGRQLVFGLVKPGEKREQRVSVAISHLEASQVVPFTVLFEEANQYAPDSISSRAYIDELARPQFVYSYQAMDDMSGNSVGNGDGRIEKGEAVDLLFTVKNEGQSATYDLVATLATLRSISGLDLPAREARLGFLAPGEYKQARLTFSTNKVLSENALQLGFVLRDDYWAIRSEKKIDVAMEEPVRVSITEIRRQVEAAVPKLKIHGGAGDSTPVVYNIDEGGVLTATGMLADWYRVEGPEGATGWVRISEVRTPAPGSPPGSKTTVIRVYEQAPPTIGVFSPQERSLKTSAVRVRVQALIQDEKGILQHFLLVNGEKVMPGSIRDIIVTGAEEAPTSLSVRIDQDVELRQGQNVITLKATDTDGLSAAKEIIVERTLATPEIWACVVGVSSYPNVRQLKYASADARAFYGYLTKDLGVPAKRVRLLLEEQATLTAVKEALGEFLKENAAEQDQVIIYFAGHGAVEDDPQRADGDGLSKYLLACNSNPHSLYSTGLPVEEVGRILNRIKAERVVFIADTCYSGATGGRTVATRNSRATLSEGFLERLAQAKGRVILASSGPNEVSFEDEALGQGVFTYYLLQALKGAADYDRDGLITVDEVFNYTRKEVPKATRQSQTPYKRGEGDVILGRTQ